MLVVTSYAQGQMEEISTGIRSGNVSLISKYFDNVVDITVNNGQSTFSHSQAEMVLKNFFKKSQVSEFNIIENGVSNGNGSAYTVGELVTKNDRYKVYISIRQKDKSYAIQEMRFEK
ncbi:MAG: DUF4783 domain-containing protein [Bacteroidota bacterium]